MPNADTSTVIVFVLYLGLMVAIGVYVYTRTKNLSDYVLGGRSLHPGVAALSAGASDMSGWLLLGMPAAIFAGGLSGAWIPVGLVLGTYASWRLVAPRLRVYTERANDSVSLSSYFDNRFEDRTRLLRIISAVVIITFFTVYVSSGFVAAGLLFEQAFGMPRVLAVTVAFVFVMLYTALGGFLADSFTDVVQGTLMFIALMTLPIVGLIAIGGFGPMFSAISDKTPELLNPVNAVQYSNGVWEPGQSVGWVAVASGIAWGLGYFGQPHILARYMGIRRPEDVKVARWIGTTWTTLSVAGASLLALLAIGLLTDPPAGVKEAESNFLVMAHMLTNPVIAAVLMAALLAAVMSTVDSQLIVVSTALTEDFYRAFVKRDASGRELLWIGRAAVVLVAIVSFALALRGGAILDIVEYAWAGFGSAFGPVVLLSLYWSRMTWTGALAGMVTGAVTVLLWPTLDTNLFGTGLYEIIPGFTMALLAIAVCNGLGSTPVRKWGGRADEPLEEAS